MLEQQAEKEMEMKESFTSRTRESAERDEREASLQ